MMRRLPAVVRLDEALGTLALTLIEELQLEMTADLTTLVAHARTPDGNSRNAGLLLAGSDWIRARPETAMRLHQAMRDTDQADSVTVKHVAARNSQRTSFYRSCAECRVWC
jgi:hypothetical protein